MRWNGALAVFVVKVGVGGAMVYVGRLGAGSERWQIPGAVVTGLGCILLGEALSDVAFRPFQETRL